jgi:drug/metabolite transporter (DMT)-like permease
VPSQYNNLAMFAVPLILFIILDLVTHQNLLIPAQFILMIVGIGVIFAYIGNVASLISIQKAPNPGYSLVISKSYVVFTSIVAVLLFHAELKPKNIVAILLIVGFSALITLSQKGQRKTSSSLWLPLSMVSFFCWGMLSLTSKYLFNSGVNVFVFLTYLYAVVTACIVIEMLKRKVTFVPISTNKLVLSLIGVGSTGFNLFQFLAIKSAPNVGYVNAINASSISAVTILAVILFKDEFSKRKMIGVLGVTAGLLLLLI